MPAISVIVPVYNVEKYIQQCVDSILAQTFKDFELILVDDGSSDLSGAICNEYAAMDSRVSVIHKKNGGVSSARNAGLDVATGKYIMFCDSDDWTEPFWLEMLYKKATDHPDKCIVSNMWRVTNEDNLCKPIGKTALSESASTYYEIWENHVSPYTPNKIYRRDIIEDSKLRFDPTIKLSEDLVCNLTYHNILEKLTKSKDIYIYTYTALLLPHNQRRSYPQVSS
jgi:glycosyltransferase involved in cell wall biosynthesis